MPRSVRCSGWVKGIVISPASAPAGRLLVPGANPRANTWNSPRHRLANPLRSASPVQCASCRYPAASQVLSPRACDRERPGSACRQQVRTKAGDFRDRLPRSAVPPPSHSPVDRRSTLGRDCLRIELRHFMNCFALVSGLEPDDSALEPRGRTGAKALEAAPARAKAASLDRGRRTAAIRGALG
jgi:hypothetical protein